MAVITLEKEDFEPPNELRQAQALANITDTAIRLPVIGIEVGLDFLIGLIPVAGDAIMTLVALRIVHLARKMGLPKPSQRIMLRNALVDFGLGFIPVVGDVIDLVFKANKRNVRIMEGYWQEQLHKGTDPQARLQDVKKADVTS